MLYLVLIFSPGTYYQSEIDTLYDQNEQAIVDVQNDAALSAQVWNDFGPDLEFIEILDDPAY